MGKLSAIARSFAGTSARAMMDNTERYRRLAREAMARSRETVDTHRRGEWLEISDSWEQLANERSEASQGVVDQVEGRVG